MSEDVEFIEDTNDPVLPMEQTGPEKNGNSQDPDNLEHIVIELSDLPNPVEHVVIEDGELPPAPSQVVAGADSIVVDLPDIYCSFCSSPIQPEETAGICKSCQTPYHEECWKANHGCAVLNCNGQGHPEKFERVIH